MYVLRAGGVCPQHLLGNQGGEGYETEAVNTWERGETFRQGGDSHSRLTEHSSRAARSLWMPQMVSQAGRWLSLQQDPIPTAALSALSPDEAGGTLQAGGPRLTLN